MHIGISSEGACTGHNELFGVPSEVQYPLLAEAKRGSVVLEITHIAKCKLCQILPRRTASCRDVR